MTTFSEFVEQNEFIPSIFLKHDGFAVEECEEQGRSVGLSPDEVKAIKDLEILDVFDDGECVLLNAEAVLNACLNACCAMGESESYSLYIKEKVSANLESLKDNLIFVLEEEGVITSRICRETGFKIWDGDYSEIDRLGLN